MRGVPGRTITSFSNDSAMGDESAPDHYSLEFLNSLDPNSMPPHELKLRSGALVMLLRNYSSQKGLCNGTRAVVRDMWHRFLQVEIATGRFKGQMHLLPRIVCSSTGETDLPFVLRKFQFPVKPAWIMSINKGRRQTVSGRCGIYLLQPVFQHGQLYVAFSRARRAVNVKVLVADFESRQCTVQRNSATDEALAYTSNIVDKTLLSDVVEAVPIGSVAMECGLCTEQASQNTLNTASHDLLTPHCILCVFQHISVHNIWWVCLRDCNAWVVQINNQWVCQLYFNTIDDLPFWGLTVPNNRSSWHVSLNSPFTWQGEWTKGAWAGQPSFTQYLGDPWLPIMYSWKRADYGQFVLCSDHVTESPAGQTQTFHHRAKIDSENSSCRHPVRRAFGHSSHHRCTCG